MKLYRLFIFFCIFLFLLILGLYLFSSKDKNNANNKNEEIKIMAFVNDIPITNFEVSRYAKQGFERSFLPKMIIDFRLNEDNDLSYEEKILEALIDRKLIYNAFKNRINMESNHIKKFIEDIISKNKNIKNEMDLKASTGIANLQEMILEISTINSVVNQFCLNKATVNYPKMIEYYKNNEDSFYNERQFDIMIINVSNYDDKKLINKLIKKLNKFNKAKRYSENRLKNFIIKYFENDELRIDFFNNVNKKQSELDIFFENNNIPKYEINKFYGPFYDEQYKNFIIFKVNDIQQPVKLSFEESYEKIIDLIKNREGILEYNKLIDGLRKQFIVTYLD